MHEKRLRWDVEIKRTSKICTSKPMLESFCNLLIGIGASVIGTYICKWLDDRNKGN